MGNDVYTRPKTRIIVEHPDLHDFRESGKLWKLERICIKNVLGEKIFLIELPNKMSRRHQYCFSVLNYVHWKYKYLEGYRILSDNKSNTTSVQYAPRSTKSLWAAKNTIAKKHNRTT
jgi:hypothetical protein